MYLGMVSDDLIDHGGMWLQFLSAVIWVSAVLLGTVCVVCFGVLVVVMGSPGGHIGPGIVCAWSDGLSPSFLVCFT